MRLSKLKKYRICTEQNFRKIGFGINYLPQKAFLGHMSFKLDFPTRFYTECFKFIGSYG